MSNIKTIKDTIKGHLDELVTSNILAGCASTDMRKDPLLGDLPNTPYAWLMPPSTESVAVDNRTLLRTYRFDIMVVVKGENINNDHLIEDLIEAMLNKFDNIPTLGGAADGAVEPATTTPEPLQHKNGSVIVFFITLKVNRTETLTF